MAGEDEYAFWHVLARDVAYAPLPAPRRAARHVAAARWIESKAGDRVEDVAQILAHHHATALELAVAVGDEALAAELRPSALRFLLLAGKRALGLDLAGRRSAARTGPGAGAAGPPRRPGSSIHMAKVWPTTGVTRTPRPPTRKPSSCTGPRASCWRPAP